MQSVIRRARAAKGVPRFPGSSWQSGSDQGISPSEGVSNFTKVVHFPQGSVIVKSEDPKDGIQAPGAWFG